MAAAGARTRARARRRDRRLRGGCGLIALPLVPARDVHATPIADINEDAIETIGWPGLAATVARVWNRLPAAERANAVVYATNYGEAGAIARYGPALGIPQRLLRAQRLLALRSSARRRAPDRRDRLPQPRPAPRHLQRLQALGDDRQPRRPRQRGARRPRLDVRGDRRLVVGALAAAALAQPLTRTFILVAGFFFFFFFFLKKIFYFPGGRVRREERRHGRRDGGDQVVRPDAVIAPRVRTLRARPVNCSAGRCRAQQLGAVSTAARRQELRYPACSSWPIGWARVARIACTSAAA